MVSEKKLAANRLNAQKSTGPKTDEGKAKSARNATTHGLFCRDVVVQGEDDDEFAHFRDKFRKSLKPRDTIEDAVVDRIVIAQWKLRRIYAAEKELFERKQRLSDYSAEEFDRLSRYEQRLSFEIHRCLRELKELQKRELEDDEQSIAQNEPTAVRNFNRTTGLEPVLVGAEVDEFELDDNEHGLEARGTGGRVT